MSRAAATGPRGPVTLALPADPGLVRLVRLVVVAVARVHEVDETLYDDIRLAAAEACARAMAAHEAAEITAPIELEVTGIKGGISLCVRDAVPMPEADGMAAAELLHAAALKQLAGVRAGGEDPTGLALSPLPESIGLIDGLADKLSVRTGPDGTTLEIAWTTAKAALA